MLLHDELSAAVQLQESDHQFPDLQLAPVLACAVGRAAGGARTRRHARKVRSTARTRNPFRHTLSRTPPPPFYETTMVSFLGLCWAVFMAAPLSPSLALRSECYALSLRFLSLFPLVCTLSMLFLCYSHTPFLCLGRLGTYFTVE